MRCVPFHRGESRGIPTAANVNSVRWCIVQITKMGNGIRLFFSLILTFIHCLKNVGPFPRGLLLQNLLDGLGALLWKCVKDHVMCNDILRLSKSYQADCTLIFSCREHTLSPHDIESQVCLDVGHNANKSTGMTGAKQTQTVPLNLDMPRLHTYTKSPQRI